MTRQGTLVGGLGDAKGGLGVFKNNIRLENLPAAKDVRVVVNGKEGNLADLKSGMSVSVRLTVKGGVTVQEITAEE